MCTDLILTHVEEILNLKYIKNTEMPEISQFARNCHHIVSVNLKNGVLYIILCMGSDQNNLLRQVCSQINGDAMSI